MWMARYEIILKFDNSSQSIREAIERDMRIRILNHPICRIIQRDMGKEFISPSCCEVFFLEPASFRASIGLRFFSIETQKSIDK